MIEIIDRKRQKPSIPVHVRQNIGSLRPPKWGFEPTSRLQLVIEAVRLFLWIRQQTDTMDPLQDVSQLISKFKGSVSDD
jgi:hypothetical protein